MPNDIPTSSNSAGPRVYEAYPDMYRFEHLPGLARVILNGHAEDFARTQYELSRQFELPLLQHLSRYSFEELMNITRSTQAEFLTCLADNAGLAMIRTSTERWLTNQLQVLHYYDVLVEDITVLNHIRAEALRRFIPQYTTDLTIALLLTSEIDRLLMGYTTSSMVTFIDLLRQRMASQETQLLEAESIAHLGSFDWDISSNQTKSSPEMRKIIGTEERITLELFLDLVHPDDSEALQNAIAEAFASGQLQCEFRFQSDGQVKTLWARGVVHFNETGVPVRMLGVIQDVTDRKRMEETLLLKTLELERSNEELQQFASVASHDLKEPLRKIALYTGLIENEEVAVLSPAGLKNLERIKDAARRMRLLIEDILAFSTLSQEQEAQPVSLDRLVADVLELLESRIRETGATIEYSGLPEAVVIPFQFRQLVQNLLSNSLKFVRPGTEPVIRIQHSYVTSPETTERLAPADRYLQLEFSDNGIGFPEHYAEKIFGLFSRLHSRNQFEGTGLGLAICRKVVENHGGRIEAFSKPGEGATFRIILPQ